jgi:hypothetical protein
VELGVDPLGLGRRTRNAAMATTMMPMMMKTMSGLGKHVLLPGGLEEEAMDCWMRDPGLRFFGGGPSGLGRHPLFTKRDEGSLSFAGASDVPLGERGVPEGPVRRRAISGGERCSRRSAHLRREPPIEIASFWRGGPASGRG